MATNVANGAAAIAREGFVLHPIRFARGKLSPAAAFGSIRALRRLHRGRDVLERTARDSGVLPGHVGGASAQPQPGIVLRRAADGSVG